MVKSLKLCDQLMAVSMVTKFARLVCVFTVDKHRMCLIDCYQREK